MNYIVNVSRREGKATRVAAFFGNTTVAFRQKSDGTVVEVSRTKPNHTLAYPDELFSLPKDVYYEITRQVRGVFASKPVRSKQLSLNLEV